MKNTSAGYHTFSFYQKVNSDDYSMLTSDFKAYQYRNDDTKYFPIKDKKGRIIGWEYTYKKIKESAGYCYLQLPTTVSPDRVLP